MTHFQIAGPYYELVELGLGVPTGRRRVRAPTSQTVRTASGARFKVKQTPLRVPSELTAMM